MGLTGKLVAAIEFKAGGDVFHEMFRHKQQEVPKASPLVHSCDLHEGEFGHVGSIVSWKYTHDGKLRTAKQIIQAIDEEKKLIEFKILEGDLMEKYKNFLVTLHVETKDNIDLVTWTFEYETLNEEVGHPISLLSCCIDVTKDIETHHAVTKDIETLHAVTKDIETHHAVTKDIETLHAVTKDIETHHAGNP